jgi:hypothetical protein
MVWLLLRRVTRRNGVEVVGQYYAVCHLISWSVISCFVHDVEVINTLHG